jgi:S1-C subfamily serine protease
MNYGRVDRSFWTGIHYDRMTASIAKYLGLKTAYGVIISDIDRGSPANKAKLEIGDVIVAIQGQQVAEFEDVDKILDNLDLKQNDVLTLRIFRSKRFFTVRLRLEAHPMMQ